MRNPRAFISFDFDNDKSERDFFVGQVRNAKTPFNVEDWSSKRVLPQKEWEALLNAKIGKCNILIVLVGKRTCTATGVIKEIKFSKDNNVPIFGIYVDGTNTVTTLPLGLPRNRIISWKWESISKAIDQCMKEGKNK